MNRIALGAYIGGSDISCQLINLDRNKPVKNYWCRMSGDSAASSNEILNDWVADILTVTTHFDLYSFAGIGFTMPGPFDYQNRKTMWMWFVISAGKNQKS